MRLPEEKLARLIETVKDWRGRKCSTKRELLSLIGQLSHAAKVVKPGRIFLSQMIRLSTVVHEMHHYIRLNPAFRSDVEWWHQFLREWNGTSIIWECDRVVPTVSFASDASGSWGAGAYWNNNWFQVTWPSFLSHTHIMIKELIPVVVACAVWGRLWSCQTVQVLCDKNKSRTILSQGLMPRGRPPTLSPSVARDGIVPDLPSSIRAEP